MQTVTITRATTARYFKGEDLIDQVSEVTFTPDEVVFHGAGLHVFDRLVVCEVMGDYFMVLHRDDVELS